jgi:hypothetical protein
MLKIQLGSNHTDVSRGHSDYSLDDPKWELSNCAISTGGRVQSAQRRLSDIPPPRWTIKEINDINHSAAWSS